MVVGLTLAGCGGGSAIDRAPGPPPCETVTRAEHPADTVTVVLFDKVDLSHAPWGRNREERFVFSHLYETLVTIDCHGEARTGPLAKSVIEASDGWLIELKEDARFWDGTPVTAQDIVSSYNPGMSARLAIESVDVVDEHTVLVHGPQGRPDIRLLSHPMFAIRKRTQERLPIGTGRWVIEADTNGEITMVPASGESPVVRFIQSTVEDVRDTIDGSTDAIITDEPTALEYARERSHGSFAPLAWDKAYLLISKSRPLAISRLEPTASLSRDFCNSLAKDAVDIDARGGSSIVEESEAAYMIRRSITVDYPEGKAPGPYRPVPEVVYSRDDPIAGSLAERIVAVAARDTASSIESRTIARALPGANTNMRAIGLAPLQFAIAVNEGRSLAYVLPLSWDADFPYLPTDLASRVPWLFDDSLRATLSQAILPLVETRAHFIAISDQIGFVDDHAGNVRIRIHTSERGR